MRLRLLRTAEAGVVPEPLAYHPQVAVTPAERIWKELTDGEHDALRQPNAVASAEIGAELPVDECLVQRMPRLAPVGVAPRLARTLLGVLGDLARDTPLLL